MGNPLRDILLLFFLSCFSCRPRHASSPLLLLSCNRSSGSFSRPGIGVASLPSNRQTFSMPQPTISPKIHQSLQIHGNFPSQISFYLMLFIDNVSYSRNFSVGKVICLRVDINTCLHEDLLSLRPTDPVNISQGYFHPLVLW